MERNSSAMAQTLRLAVTADLHWGHNRLGDQATLLLRDALLASPPDVLILGGDVGTGHHFAECLTLFADLPCLKALVPGNHDIWVLEDDPRGDSLTLYREGLATQCAARGFHYLDGDGPLHLGGGLAVVGSINWYDYSWSLDWLRANLLEYEERLRTKRFDRGRHNDARFVRWPLDDVRFTAQVVETFGRHLDAAFQEADRALVVTHHPAFYGLSFPGERSETVDRYLWDAFTGNAALERLLTAHAERIPLVFSGHTHRSREGALGVIRGFNVGGDYHFKRLLTVEWPSGEVSSHLFGDPLRRNV
jgi:3',5'-cyclic AMP phosphodiesterase CpdA